MKDHRQRLFEKPHSRLIAEARAIISKNAMEGIYSTFYHLNLWFGSASRSGPGSDIEITSVIRREFPLLVERLGIKRLLDIPCGDFNWMKEVRSGVTSYIGADIVPGIIKDNNIRYADGTRRFIKLNIVSDKLPQADLVLCRDCLVHMPHRYVEQALKNIKRSDSTYLLTTTFPFHKKNKNIAFTGLWRPLNFQAAPYNFPEPLVLIDEKNTYKTDRYPGKSLGLWRISDLEV